MSILARILLTAMLLIGVQLGLRFVANSSYVLSKEEWLALADTLLVISILAVLGVMVCWIWSH